MNLQAILSLLKKHPIGVGGVLLAVLLLGLTVVRMGTLGDLETQLLDTQDQADRLKNNLRYSTNLDEDLATMEQAVAAVEAKAINPSALATNLQFFYRLEQELELELIDLRQGVPVESQTKTTYQGIPYNVTVEGTYLQLLAFLQRLEDGDRIVKFVTINLSEARGVRGEAIVETTDPRLSLSLDITLLGRS